MSDLHGVSADSTSDAAELAHQQQSPANNPPQASSSQQRSHALTSALSSRGSTQVGQTSGSQAANTIRRTAAPQISSTTTALRRHSLSGASGSRIEGEIGEQARDVANRFTQLFAQMAPIDSPDPSTRLQQHEQRMTAMTQVVRDVFEGVARQSTSSDTRITVLQSVPHTPEIQAARIDVIRKTNVADNLGAQALDLRRRASTLKEAANQAGESARTLAADRREADRVAQTQDGLATKAEAAAAKAADAAKSKGFEADQARNKAESAQRAAATLDVEATKAEQAAQRAKSAADAKADEANHAGDAARDARTTANLKAGEADRAEAAVGPLREAAGRLAEEATRAAAAAAQASDKEKPAAQAAAQQAQARASEAEGAVKAAEKAAKDARTAAEQADEHADQLATHAQTLQEQATELRGIASEAENGAGAARSAADDAKKTAEALTRTASTLHSEATSLRMNAEKLAKEAAPLRAAADQAKADAKEAAAKQARAETHADDAERAAREAEQAATDAERAAQTAREEADDAGRTLREVIARTPLPQEATQAPTSTSAGNARQAETAAATDAATAAGETSAAQRSRFTQWAINTAAVSGQQFVAVGIATALREAVGAATEALLTHTNASDHVKAGIAGGLYGSVILANLMTILYHEQQKTGNAVTHAGNIAQIVALAAALISAAATDTLKDLVPSLIKTFAYSGWRDGANLMLVLSDNVPEGKANPLAVQAVNAFFYTANQMLVNSIQSFHGVSGAGFVDAMQKNATDPNTHEAETLLSGFASLATYVVGNYAGEDVDQLLGRTLNSAMSGSNPADLRITLTPQAWPGAEKAWDTFAEDGVSRTSVFYSVYGLTAAINPQIPARHLGEAGASWAQNCVGGAFIALLTLPALMTMMKKVRNAVSGGGGGGEEQGRITSASSSERSASPAEAPTEDIALRRMAPRGNEGDNGGTSSRNQV
jgi:hypothetical protein